MIERTKSSNDCSTRQKTGWNRNTAKTSDVAKSAIAMTWKDIFCAVFCLFVIYPTLFHVKMTSPMKSSTTIEIAQPNKIFKIFFIFA